MSLSLIILAVSAAGAGFSFLYLTPPYHWLGIGFLVPAFNSLPWAKLFEVPVVSLAGMKWNDKDFVRGWLITGKTGSGKTESAIKTLTFEVFKNRPLWGGVCLDQKGLFWEFMEKMAAHFLRDDDLVLLKVEKDENVVPRWTINITGDSSIPGNTYAKTIADTFAALGGGKSDKSFFPNEAQLMIGTGFEVLRLIKAHETIPNVYDLLLNETTTKDCIGRLYQMNTTRSNELGNILQDQYINKPAEQLGGVQSTIRQFLAYFMTPSISKTFCAENPTFQMKDIDDGKIVCVAMPQRYATERLFVNTFLKLLYYFHALSRFDLSDKERKQKNLIILWADEGQEIITGAESAFADHRAAGVIREANATIILATQAYSSILAALDEKFAKVLMLNLSNELIFTVADDDSAKTASKNIGERIITTRSWGNSGGKTSSNYQRETKPFYEPFQLRNLKKFECVIRHCERGFRKTKLPPRDTRGKIPSWYYA